MPDITMCKGGDCPLKETCRRYRVEPDPVHQSYFAEVSYNEVVEQCIYYWEHKLLSTGEEVKNDI